MGYSKAEQETVLAFDGDKNLWKVYSTVPKHIRKLQSLGEMKVIEEENGKPICVQGELSEKQVSKEKRAYIIGRNQREITSKRISLG